jgi:hypothetical protein
MSTIKRLLKRIKYYIQRNNSYPKTIITEALKMVLLLLVIALFVCISIGIPYTLALIIQIILAAIIGKQIPLYICVLILIFIYGFTNLTRNKL